MSFDDASDDPSDDANGNPLEIYCLLNKSKITYKTNIRFINITGF